ncbi:uncharacterized protein LOC115884078 isoform X5 [Sitophilus oryzae]|uniref:Uncharacterized protein LOC115884078 isoform X5 n=1 Tax=Sitophilus oryzae TaxID=7048 RepID=A0A6J2Y5U6_SITOR|nr:uncharacterized protein LOC115884078 isoform X5 [Sitophilus oryzae]
MLSGIAVLGGIGSVLLCLALSSCLICLTSAKRRQNKINMRQRQTVRRRTQQQEQNVYSISGRVQGQEQQQRFPEAFVSVEHISIMNEMNKPPKYDDAPPSYEEAIKIAMAQNNSMETLRAEQAGVHQASSSSSVTVVQPAVPNRTTE